jgi:dUTP pyrophosphatase
MTTAAAMAIATAPQARAFNSESPFLAAVLILHEARGMRNGNASIWRYGPPLVPCCSMDRIELRVLKLRPSALLPARGTPHATGLDLFACLDAPLALRRAPSLVPTGIAIEFPPGYDAQVRPRSGLSSKGVGVALGTVDADYRGELFVTMWVFGDLDAYEIRHGDRIAQLVVAPLAPLALLEVAELTDTQRGVAGHGSTGR